MSFAKELREIDTEKIGEIFEELFPTPERMDGNEPTSVEFVLNEIQRSDLQFPVFGAIVDRYIAIVPELRAHGIDEGHLKAFWAGMHITQMVLSNYAETEIPDTFVLEP